MSNTTLSELLEAGLLDDGAAPRLTVKGRDWLRVLEDAQTHEIATGFASDEDFVMATSGLWR